MKIVADSKIPYLQGLLEPVAQEVLYVPGGEITSDIVRDAQVLLTRTRTRCDARLLDGSAVEFIGTATIGTDHIDLDYCRSHNITVVNAPGCNAPAVAQWTHASILQWMAARKVDQPLTIGIVGVGHVGSIVARWAQQLGFRTLLNDPPLEELASKDKAYISSPSKIEGVTEGRGSMTSPLTLKERVTEGRGSMKKNSELLTLNSELTDQWCKPNADVRESSPSKIEGVTEGRGSMKNSELLTLNSKLTDLSSLLKNCDIITFHTPLTREGDYPTWHLCDETFLQSLQRCKLILNAARGAVCDNDALLRWHGDVALDCWEGEPAINPALLDKAFIATPHIAGYSLQGKQRGTAMIIEALNRRYGWNINPVLASTPFGGAELVTPQTVLDSYNPLDDTAQLKAAPANFEALRNQYPLRNEIP